MGRNWTEVVVKTEVDTQNQAIIEDNETERKKRNLLRALSLKLIDSYTFFDEWRKL